ncbi:MAG: hypothetical protein BroJett029_40140 [Alphaproteobacteria bacterium]|nr:MAG: hypothetical protein BroJett029_40140 [Alphaproteobacteria bacterium]
MLACCALALAVTGHAEEKAKEPKAPSKAMLKKYDADNDGKLSDAEKAKAKADEKAKRDEKRQQDLKEYDANADGKINKDEREKMKADKAAEREARKAGKEARKAEKGK